MENQLELELVPKVALKSPLTAKHQSIALAVHPA